MSKFLKSIGSWIRGKDNELSKNMSDPVRDGKFAIEDSKKQVKEFTIKISQLIAANKRVEREIQSAHADVIKYQGFAEKAASTGNEPDCREALRLKSEAQQQVESLSQETVKNQQIIDALRANLNSARAKISSAERNMISLSARKEGAKVRKELSMASSKFNINDGPLSKLNDLEKAVIEEETEAEAWDELSSQTDAGTSLEEKYGSGVSSDVDDEVKQLMGLKMLPKK
jgi:phage shock protein A